jgi:hypothetical protein
LAIANRTSLSSRETGVNPGINSWKKYLSEWTQCWEVMGGFYFTNNWRAEAQQAGLKLCLEIHISSQSRLVYWNASPGWTAIFLWRGCDDRGYLKEEVVTYLMAPMSPVRRPTFFPLSHILLSCLWVERRSGAPCSKLADFGTYRELTLTNTVILAIQFKSVWGKHPRIYRKGKKYNHEEPLLAGAKKMSWNSADVSTR